MLDEKEDLHSQQYKSLDEVFIQTSSLEILRTTSVIKNKKLSNNLKLNILKELNNSSNISSKLKIRNASINSKEIKKNDTFFAIKGKNNDGNLSIMM